MCKQNQLPAGTYLPLRAWITTPIEIALLAKTEEQYFTYTFTPDGLLNLAEAGQNLIRDQGMTQSSLSFWPRDLLKQFLRLVRRRSMKPWPAEDFRIHSNGKEIAIYGKIKHVIT